MVIATQAEKHGLEGAERSVDSAVRTRLADPTVAEAIDNLLRMSPDLAGAASLLIGFVQRSSQIAENVNGIVDTARQASSGPDGRAGAGLAELVAKKDRLLRLVELAERLEPVLSNPETLRSLTTLVESLPKITAMLRLVELFIGRSSDMAENFNGVVDTFRTAINKRWTNEAERDRIARLPGRLMDTIESESLQRLLESFMLSPEGLDVLDRLLRSGAFRPEALSLIGRASAAAVEAEKSVRNTGARVGPLGMLKALNDPDVQRGLAHAVELARLYGRGLAPTSGAAGGV